jgi:hypothetical protein
MQTIFLILSHTAMWSLLLLPPLLMVMRSMSPRLMPLWAMMAATTLGGWFLAVVGVMLYDAYLDLVVGAMSNPDIDDPVVRRWMADGARNVFAVLFGWLYGPVLWLLWSPLLVLVHLVRARRRGVENE